MWVLPVIPKFCNLWSNLLCGTCVKRLPKVHNNHIDRCFGIYGLSKVVDSENQLGLARMICAKSVLSICENLVFREVPHDVTMQYVFKEFTTNRCQIRHRSIIGSSGSIPFLKMGEMLDESQSSGKILVVRDLLKMWVKAGASCAANNLRIFAGTPSRTWS